MLRLDVTNRWYLVWTSLISVLIFIITAILVNLVLGNGKQNMIIPAAGSLVAGLLLIPEKKKVFRMAAVFLIGYPLICLALFPTGYADTVKTINLMVVFYAALGIILALFMYGKKSVWIFTMVFGLAGVSLALLSFFSGFFNTWFYNVLGVFGRTNGINRISSGFLPDTIALGIALGLSIGLYRHLNSKKE